MKTLVSANGFVLVKLQYNKAKNLVQPVSQANAVSGGGETLIYKGLNDEKAPVFSVLKDLSGKIYNMTFDVRTYLSYQGGGFNYYGSYSGAYIFRPSDYQQDSLPYNQLVNVTTFSGAGFVQEMYLYFQSEVAKNASAVVVVRYYDEGQAAEWDVHLSSVPVDDDQGREVTVNWKLDNFNNNRTFYTDSNGLEMQKRVLNWRQSYDFLSFEEVSGNYYPINSALAIVDEI